VKSNVLEALRENRSTSYEIEPIYNSTGLKLHTPGPKYKSSKNKIFALYIRLPSSSYMMIDLLIIKVTFLGFRHTLLSNRKMEQVT